MDKTLGNICELLGSADNTRRSAAAIVLAELAPKDDGVVKALGAALADANDLLTKVILDALVAIGSPAGASYALPLLDSADMDIRMRAVQVTSLAGNAIVPEAMEMMKTAQRGKKLLILDLLARIHTRDALDAILDRLFESDFGLVKEACDAVRRHASETPPKERLKLHQQVLKFMKTQEVQASERVLTSSLLLLGHIGRPEALPVVLKYASQKTVPYVRRHAFIALKGVDVEGRAAKAMLGKMLPYLEDEDEDIARHTLDILSKLPAGDVSGAKWRALLKGRHGSVRAYAARMLAASDTVEANKLLLDLLKHDDNEIRETAERALGEHPRAVPALLKRLALEKDSARAWALVRILKKHVAVIDAKAAAAVRKLAAKAYAAAAGTSEPLMAILHDLDPKACGKLLLEAGMAHRKAKRWTAAIESLRRLIHTETFTDEVSYALSVCDLKVSHKELAPQYRAEDHALRGFGILRRRNESDLMQRLKKDRSLDAADMYYVGFHFADGTGDEPAFGKLVLEHVARTWPKSDEAKSARERLKAM